MKLKLILPVFILFFLGNLSNLSAKPPHDGYVKTFGWGGIAVTSSSDPEYYPPLSSYDASKFKYKNGVNYIKAGQPFAMRALFKDGKTIQQLVADFKKETGKNYPEYQVYYWTSHWKDGSPLKAAQTNWPSSKDQIPSWMATAKGYRAVISERNLHFQGSGYSWNVDTPNDIKTWIQSISKPGHKMYIAIRLRGAAPNPSGKFWNKNTNRWVIPDRVYYSKPIASTTVVFE